MREMLGKIKILILYSSILLVGCDRFDAAPIFAFRVDKVECPEPKSTLHSEQTNIKGELLTDFIIRDSSIIIHDWVSKEFFVKVRSLETGSIQGRFCRHGRGPDEFVSPVPLSSVGDNAGMFDFITGYYSELNIKRSLDEGTTILDRRIKFDNPTAILPALYSITKIDDRCILAFDGGQNTGPGARKIVKTPCFSVFDVTSGKLVKEYQIFNGFSESIQTKYPRFYLDNTSRRSCYNPELRRVFFSMRSNPVYGILDLDSGEVRGFRLSKEPCSRRDKSVATFSDVCTDGKNIYALYFAGFPIANVSPTEPTTLFVFNWEGEILGRYKLDAPFGSCRVNNGKLYMSTLDSIETDLRVVDLEQLNI